MALVIRSNYGDDSIALIENIKERELFCDQDIYVVYIETGWAASHWKERVQQGEAYVQAAGLNAIHLTARTSFPELVLERNQFPSKKFQWCAGFLKGLPLLEWLDEYDPVAEWQIAIPKRQALYRQKIPEVIQECAYHGERTVLHPILTMNESERDRLLIQAGFTPLHTRSLECEPCTNSTMIELQWMSKEDCQKLAVLEQKIQKPMFSHCTIDNIQNNASPKRMDAFSMGCGDPFGCGL